MHWPESPEPIDRQLRHLAHDLAQRELAFARALDAFFSADGWRRLGYATAKQYARERLGLCLSSVKAKRRLVKRLGQLRFLAAALERGDLGYEAARLVAQVATPAGSPPLPKPAATRTSEPLSTLELSEVPIEGAEREVAGASGDLHDETIREAEGGFLAIVSECPCHNVWLLHRQFSR